MKVRLTTIIIAYNEEYNIGRCIQSVLPISEEIIVIDSCSSDRTAKIASDLGARVVQQEWQGYSPAKNIGNDLANGDFIFSIDADEALSPDLADSIQNFKNNPNADAIEINRLTNYCGKWIRHGGWYPEYKIRIFKTGAASWEGVVHEELKFTTQPILRKINGDLLHYSYPNIESHLHKILKYAKLAAEKRRASGKKMSFFGDALIKPWFTFIRKYFFQLGMLDGYYGFVIAINSAFERFLRYVYYRQLR